MTLLFFVYTVITFALISFVLLQPAESGGLRMGSGSGNSASLFTVRGLERLLDVLSFLPPVI